MSPEIKNSILRLRSSVFNYTRLIRRLFTENSTLTKHFVLKANETDIDVNDVYSEQFAVYVDGVRYFKGTSSKNFTLLKLADGYRITLPSFSLDREVKVIIDDFADRPSNLLSYSTRRFVLDVLADNPVLEHGMSTKDLVLNITDLEGVPMLTTYRPIDEYSVRINMTGYRGQVIVYANMFDT